MHKNRICVRKVDAAPNIHSICYIPNGGGDPITITASAMEMYKSKSVLAETRTRFPLLISGGDPITACAALALNDYGLLLVGEAPLILDDVEFIGDLLVQNNIPFPLLKTQELLADEKKRLLVHLNN